MPSQQIVFDLSFQIVSIISKMFKEIILVSIVLLVQGAIFDPLSILSDPLTFQDQLLRDPLDTMHSSTINQHKCTRKNSQETQQQAEGCQDNENYMKDITNQPDRFRICLDSISHDFPQFQPFDVLQVHESTIDSMEKHLRLKKRDESGHEMFFKVIEQAQTPPKVILQQYLHANGYTKQEIEEALVQLVETIPSLEDHKLAEAWSSKKSQNGKSSGQLVLKLVKDEDEKIVYLTTEKGKSWIAVYGL